MRPDFLLRDKQINGEAENEPVEKPVPKGNYIKRAPSAKATFETQTNQESWLGATPNGKFLIVKCGVNISQLTVFLPSLP